MRSGGKAVARRASALLMSALLAFSTCPVEAMAQEQDDGETESPVLLVDDDGVTTDEMGNFAQELPPTEPIEDEILDQTAEDEAEPLEEDLNQTPEDTDEAGQPVGEETQGTEEPTVTEDSQEASESLSIEPIREQSTGTMLVDENPSGKSYFFDLSDEADKTTAKVKVYGMTSGNVSYDAATGTLQLNNANVNGEIESDGDITLELVGGNTVRGYDSFYEGSYYDNEARDYVYYEDYANGHKNSYDAAIDVNGMLTVNSDGSINTYYSVSCTSLEIKNGTIDSSINTNGGKATISGGTVSSVDTNGGSATVSGGDVGSVYTSGGNATVSGGTVNDGVYTGKRNDDEEYTVLGDLSISNGTIYGGISCGKLTVTDGTIISGDDYYDKNQLSCTSLEMKGGKIDGTAYTNGGNATVTGGNITSDIDAGNGSRYSESTAWGNVTISNGTIGADISCSILKINGKTKIGGKAYTHGSDATVTGGTITGGVNTGKRNDDEDYVGWGSIIISNGTISNGVSCGKLMVTGGTIIGEDDYYDDGRVSCESLEMKGGKIEGTVYTNGGNATITGGTITGGVNTGKRNDDEDYVGWGNITISNGTIGSTSCGVLKVDNKARINGCAGCDALIMSNGWIGGASCGSGNATISGGTIAGGVSCGKLTVTGSPKIAYKHSSDYRLYDSPISCEALSLRKGTITIVGNGQESTDPIKCDSLSMSGGSITVSKWGSYSFYRSISTKQLYVSGGSINASVDVTYEDSSYRTVRGSASIMGGTISGSVVCGRLTISGGSVNGSVSGTTITMSGGSVNYKGTGANDDSTVISCTTFTMKGGSIKASRCGDVISCKKMTMAGGSIRADNCDGGIEATEYADAKTASITIKKGKIVMNNPNPGYRGCISSSYGNITIKGGTITIKGSYGGGISAGGSTYRGKHYGGKVKITGGKLTIINRSFQSSAISADSITNKPSCLKKIVGRFSTGARFKSGGNTYQVSDYSDVNIYRYGSKKKEAKFKQITFGKNKYSVSGIAAKAFNTKRGAALTSITFNNSLRKIGANAFMGTKSLRNLVLKSGLGGVYIASATYSSSGNTYRLRYNKEYKYPKKAFSGIGSNKGANLTIAIRGGGAYRTYLLKKGLPRGVRFIDLNS